MKKFILFYLIFIFIIPALAQNSDESYKIYDDNSVARIDITIDPAAVDWMYENSESDSLHLGTLHFKNNFINETVDSIGFRIRGNTSRSSAKKSFKVSFNDFVPGREFYGVDKLNLNGEHNDPSIVRSKLCWDLFEDAGILASRASFAEVYINEEYYGLYISVEHIDDEFLKKNFADDSGNLWKCLYPADLVFKGTDQNLYKNSSGGRRAYDLTTNEEEDDYSQLVRLINIINNASNNIFPDSIEKVLEVSEVLKYFAMNILLGSWDDYRFLMNNYYLYHNPSEDKFHWIPYDYDNTFGIDWFNTNWAAIDPYEYSIIEEDHQRPLSRRLLEHSAFRNLFTHFLEFYNENLFKLELWEDRIDSIKNLITPFAQADPYRSYDYGFTMSDFHNSYSSPGYSNQHVKMSIKDFINERYISLDDQLEYIADAGPVAYNLEWHPKNPTNKDTIFVNVSAFSYEGLKNVMIQFTPDSMEMLKSFPLSFNPVEGTKKVEEADRWVGVIPPLKNDGSGSFRIYLQDNNDNVLLYPRDKSIKINIPAGNAADLVINEILASNSSTNSDEAGQYDDWIEIYNPSDADIIISGMYLSDKENNLTKWKIPGENLEIKSGEYLLIWCDEDEEQGNFHSNFQLSANGEYVALTDVDGVSVIDAVSFGPQLGNISYGRVPDAGNLWLPLVFPTPGRSNIITGIEDEENLPAEFSLEQNFPNPFNPITKIRYSIPASLLDKENGSGQAVTLKVYDILGNEIAVLVNAEKPAGTYEVIFDASGLSSGIYFYKMRAGDFIDTKKLLLIK